MDDVIIKKGKKPGVISVVLAGVHGNERSGILAFRKILPQLEIESGVIYFIYGNPMAIKENKRFIEFNLNRAFLDDDNYLDDIKKTYEFNRAKFIKKYLDKASALLDLHSAQEDTEPFIFAEKNTFDVIKFFPRELSRVVSGIEDVEPGGTDGYMSRKGKIGICVECGQHNDKKAVDIALKSIQAFIVSRGHISDKHIKKNKPQRDFIHLSYAYYTKKNFILKKQFKDFSFIKKGELIGYDGGEEIKAPFDGIILFARERKSQNLEAFLFAKNSIL